MKNLEHTTAFCVRNITKDIEALSKTTLYVRRCLYTCTKFWCNALTRNEDRSSKKQVTGKKFKGLKVF